ncbi:prion-inhibition and propagation-domain-containing protein [Ilyonectria robusta]|uniref:prion-inhibition and propagation-domain-containing protein n=1 Tax=Ilyonectria robusta TaxID=1079257 RepID=UPI001E8D7A71|nr:prion-inhibition and propagation-domain-containing protein [Ilyonectria robusta]KAH8679242.1 prion-inhibition and propagation-domain-containing protein [Ilyonectria robusta]
MAEVFGVAASALSVAALFNNCVDCFEYIKLNPHFGPVAERCQLKLDVARNRLGRWGEAAAINTDPRFPTNARDSRQVRAILEEIALLFHTSRESSKHNFDARPDPMARFEVKNMTLAFWKPHD